MPLPSMAIEGRTSWEWDIISVEALLQYVAESGLEPTVFLP